jgi:hypothetical protein
MGNGFAATIFSVMGLFGAFGTLAEAPAAPHYAAANKTPLHGFIVLLRLRYDLFGSGKTPASGPTTPPRTSL